MDKFSIQNILKISSLENELELEKASSIFLKLRKLIKGNDSYQAIRNHLRSLIRDYEQNHWEEEDHITDEQIKDSDLAEALVKAENEFISKRKVIIRNKLKEAGLNQNDLAKILGHRKGYMSELISGLRPFSKEDLIVINRLFKIKFEDLIPPYIKLDRALHIKKTLQSISNSKIKLSESGFDLQLN